MTNLRINCAQIVQTILEDKVFFSELKKQIAEKDLPFANMLILSTLRHWLGLNRILDSFLQKKIPNKHRLARYLLLLAMTELLLMQTAPHAVINETVDNIRHTTDKFLGGLANAVLRKIAAQKADLLQKLLSSNRIPASFSDLLNGYTKDEIAQVNTCLLNQPALDLTVKSAPEQWVQKLSAELMPNGSLRLSGPIKITALSGYTEGAWWVQDVAASLPVLAMGNICGQKVIDLCAAPGGKTAQLAAGGADVTALDISAERLDTLKQNMARLGFENVCTVTADALDFMQTTREQFDAVLLDAPCSATGTFRRHPEVLHLKTVDDVHEQAALQAKLLAGCKNILKVGGILVYSVCSICRREGEEQISRFLSEHTDFRLIPIEPSDISPYGTWQYPLITPEGYIRTLPFYQNGMDSFFICKLQRII